MGMEVMTDMGDRHVNIQILEKGDAGDLWALRKESLFTDPHSFSASEEDDAFQNMSHVEALLSDDCLPVKIFGARENQELVGMIGLQLEKKIKHRHRIQLWGMYVRPPYRRRGIANQLIEVVIHHARQMNHAEFVCLTVTSQSTSAQSLYARHGFKVWGIEPESIKVDGVNHDGIHMIYRL
jgi:ribosomal protein S18 acetylase RimI-like enzyme